jgi:hypothetical protein
MQKTTMQKTTMQKTMLLSSEYVSPIVQRFCQCSLIKIGAKFFSMDDWMPPWKYAVLIALILSV